MQVAPGTQRAHLVQKARRQHGVEALRDALMQLRSVMRHEADRAQRRQAGHVGLLQFGERPAGDRMHLQRT